MIIKMTPSKIFKIVNLIAIIQWLLMVFAPRWVVTDLIVESYAIPLLLALVYGFYIFSSFGEAKGGFSSLEGVGKLFQNPKALLAGWVHYLVFDLFVGTYEYQQAPLVGMPHWVLIPCLFLTLMLGPLGFLLFYVLCHTLYVL